MLTLAAPPIIIWPHSHTYLHDASFVCHDFMASGGLFCRVLTRAKYLVASRRVGKKKKGLEGRAAEKKLLEVSLRRKKL